MVARAAVGGPVARIWPSLGWPAVSGLAAAATLAYALFATGSGATFDPPATTPERAAQEFAEAYQARDWQAALRVAAGPLRRTLEQRARSARLQGHRAVARPRRLEIEESFLLERERLRFTGTLLPAGPATGRGWPVSITVARHGDRYLAEALSWPKGAPPDER